MTGNSRTEYVYDGRGSVAAEVSYNTAWYTFGGVLARKNVTPKSYTPFGELLTEQTSGFGYNGEYYNAATGMIYLRARFYAPEMNRFSQKDVLRGAATEPQSLNRYLYVQNDPVDFCDPSGERTINTMMADGGGVRRISSAPTVVKPGVSTRAVTATPRNNTVSIPMTDTGTGGSRSAKTAAQTAANATTSRGTTAAGTTASDSASQAPGNQYGDSTRITSDNPCVADVMNGGNSSCTSRFGQYPIDSTFYNIFVPLDGSYYNSGGWNTTGSTRILSEGKFDISRAIPYIKMENFNAESLRAGKYIVNDIVTNTESLTKAGIAEGIRILVDVLNRSVYSTFIDVITQEKNGEQRVIIALGSSDAVDGFNRAYYSSRSAYAEAIGSPFSMAMVSYNSQLLYESITGESGKIFATYDTQFSIDAQHSDGYEYYLWYDDDTQTAMAYPVFYPEDNVSVGRRGFMGLHLIDAVDVPMNPSSIAVPEYNYLFGGEQK